MPRVHPRKRCKQCGRSVEEVGPTSARGRCKECWELNEYANIVQLAHHDGPYFDYWRRRMAASVGAVLVDDLRVNSGSHS